MIERQDAADSFTENCGEMFCEFQRPIPDSNRNAAD